MIAPNAPIDALVIGAGPAGLATAASLRGRGIRALVLEREDEVASSWRRHYDRLHLHTPRQLSGLPGLPIPSRMGRWVARDDLVEYLETYAAHHGLEVRTGSEVARVERSPEDDCWLVHLTSGATLAAPYIVMATGFNHTPRLPDLPGVGDFTGRLLMAREYRTGRDFVGQDVLVVGTGNTGTEIAVDLAEQGAGRVRLAVRTPPHIQRRDFGPWAAQYGGIMIRHLPLPVGDAISGVMSRLTTPDLSSRGLDRPEVGLLTRAVRDNAIPVQDVGIIDAISTGKVTPVPSVERFDGSEVVLVDGTRLSPDTVLLATGYDQGLEPLIGHLGVLDAKGRPRVSGGRVAPGAPGMWYLGFSNPISGMLREINRDARKIASAMAMDRQRTRRAA